MPNLIKAIVLSIFVLLTNYAFGQGCSDAGFCTINSFKPKGEDTLQTTHNHFKIGASVGKADNNILAWGSYLEYHRQLGSQFGIDVKLTSLAQIGNNITSFGISDVFVNTNFKATKKLNLTAGIKIPLSTANHAQNNLPLPMDYQASLGTFDLIVGIGYQISKLQLVVALQQPLTQNNNQFVAANYPNTSELSKFQSTKNFQRSGDILLRVAYPFMLSQKLRFTPSILPIYHLANDKYTDELNVEKVIKDSQGLTLNGNIFLDYELNPKNTLQLNVGMPLIVRKSRPDGLTRSFIVSVEYKINF
jgi:hypothetical protein